MARPQWFRRATLVVSNILLPVAVLIFASGFFPYKPFMPGLATFEDADGQDKLAASLPFAPFDRVVFMVVDALRSDFVYGHGTGFTFTQSLVRAGSAIPFTAHATPPTVTMPRIKALTTGSVPSFLDLILNFAESDTSSSLATQDTWLAQLRAKQHGKLVFYGDDTWLKLFPGDFFVRADGTSSFFVSDFTEVDNNVTRHVPEELRRDDWNAMIMHYLGLDHIGHKTGPQGPSMLPKQKEMDDIVKMIYTAIETETHHKNTLLVLAGDHGMNGGGNHGGSGPGETEPALLFASPKFQQMPKVRKYECPTTPKPGTEFHFYTKMEQSDVVPTLAALMGFPISRNNLGVCMPELMGLWDTKQRVQLLKQNAKQILHIVEAAYGMDSFNAALASFTAHEPSSLPAVCKTVAEGEQELACKWALATRLEEDESAIDALYEFLRAAQESMSSTASSYNITRMIAGVVISAASLLTGLFSFPSLWPPSLEINFLALTSVLYGVMMFASSYVEEEQHFWYWITPAWLAMLAIRKLAQRVQRSSSSFEVRNLLIPACYIPIILLHRLAIRWNQTGQKHAGEPDIVTAIFPQHHILLWVLILATYLTTIFQIATRTFAGLLSPELAASLAVTLTLPAIVFKLNFTQADAPELVQDLAERIRDWSKPLSLVLQARLAFALLGLAVLMTIVLGFAASKRNNTGSGLAYLSPARLHPILTLFLITQSRAPNVPLFLLMEVQAALLRLVLRDSRKHQPSVPKSHHTTALVIETALTTLLFSHTTFFCFGGSNSISSLDLSNAYNGVADYNIVAVGVLLYASNWTGPVWWATLASSTLLPQIRQPPVVHKPSVKSDERSWVEEERTKLHADAVAAVKRSTDNQPEVNGVQDDVWLAYMTGLTLFFAASLLAVMAACTALRTHLFIWTVFSPKYLYAMAWSVGWHLIVNAGLGSLLWLLAVSASKGPA